MQPPQKTIRNYIKNKQYFKTIYFNTYDVAISTKNQRISLTIICAKPTYKQNVE